MTNKCLDCGDEGHFNKVIICIIRLVWLLCVVAYTVIIGKFPNKMLKIINILTHQTSNDKFHW